LLIAFGRDSDSSLATPTRGRTDRQTDRRTRALPVNRGDDVNVLYVTGQLVVATPLGVCAPTCCSVHTFARLHPCTSVIIRTTCGTGARSLEVAPTALTQRCRHTTRNTKCETIPLYRAKTAELSIGLHPQSTSALRHVTEDLLCEFVQSHTKFKPA